MIKLQLHFPRAKKYQMFQLWIIFSYVTHSLTIREKLTNKTKKTKTKTKKPFARYFKIGPTESNLRIKNSHFKRSHVGLFLWNGKIKRFLYSASLSIEKAMGNSNFGGHFPIKLGNNIEPFPPYYPHFPRNKCWGRTGMIAFVKLK